MDDLENALHRYLSQRDSQEYNHLRGRRVGIADGEEDFFPRAPYGERPSSSSSRPSSRSRGGYNDIDTGYNTHHYDYALSPPKVSDSLSLRRSGHGFGSAPVSPRSSYDRGFMSPGRGRSASNPVSTSRESIQVPRTSPSKVGTKMWGNETPLARKGRVPSVDDDGKWCCAVCLYVENPLSAERCLVCDSPNYSLQKVLHFCYFNSDRLCVMVSLLGLSS